MRVIGEIGSVEKAWRDGVKGIKAELKFDLARDLATPITLHSIFTKGDLLENITRKIGLY